MAEPTGGAATLLTLKYIWGILMVPIGWLWTKNKEQDKRIQDLERQMRNLPTRQEVKDTVADATRPIERDVNDIKGDVKEVRTLLTEFILAERNKP